MLWDGNSILLLLTPNYELAAENYIECIDMTREYTTIHKILSDPVLCIWMANIIQQYPESRRRLPAELGRDVLLRTNRQL